MEDGQRLSRVLGYLAFAGIAIVFLAAGGVWFGADRALAVRVTVSPGTFDARGGDVDRGKHFAIAVANCTGCHGGNLGGDPIIDNPGIAVIYAPNLTSGAGGIGAQFSDADFERAIRLGITPDGTRLMVMPSEMYSALSDADLRDVIAYVRSVPPVDNATKARSLGFLGRLGFVLGKFPFAADRIDQNASHAASMPPAADAQYGQYLVRLGNCAACHGADFAGRRVFDTLAPNITPAAIGSWTLAEFVQTLRNGQDPSGHQLSTKMPWPEIGRMNDQELTAIYLFLESVPPVAKT